MSALIKILLGETPVRCRNRDVWIQSVQDYFEDVPLCVSCHKLLQLVWETAPQMGCKVYLVQPDGSHLQETSWHCGCSLPWLWGAYSHQNSKCSGG